ncbi:hypothetical protein AM588_10000603 [Phytophthora nicotianae]|uniref:Crinkler (CRN) family protein n=1 Tax=Phytophthora nicotianae TaxID=4792 RepID=A0A0W8CIE2_PHYNI|nr:hypothetical protein AM588_10000603 [Phytophthora nicotianae]
MSSLGGCTRNGKIFWRLEDKQVVSILVDGWFRESTVGNINVRANKKSILMGSPGIGKSTLLCVMAFYLVFKHKKNVLVYRRLTKFEQENCLFYLGYEDGKVVQFSVLSCEESEAKRIYKLLRGQHGVSNVWLLLDGFRYQDIPEGVRTFKMLATSQQVNLKSQERVDAYCCLLSCWAKKDLWLVGNLVYQYATKDMEERFYYSGGSVREFTLATSEDIRSAIDDAISGVDDISNLLSNNSSVLTGTSQADRLRHTFVKDADDTNHFIARRYWEQVIDSEYAVLTLSIRLRSDALFRIYAWARSAKHGSLAGSVFEVYVHSLAADNMLRLHISEYDPPTYRKPNEPRGYEFKPVLLKTGTAVQWGTSGESSEYKPYLEEWRDNNNLTYWFPACDNFPNIDSIVKLESGGVAYLQVTVAEKHKISSTHMNEMNAIFGGANMTIPPIYIAICPDRNSCQKFVLNSRAEAVLARRMCPVFVGYFEEYQLASAADGPKNNISVKPVPPEHTYSRRKRQRAS